MTLLTLLTFLLGVAIDPAAACGLNHCPRPAEKERTSLAWSVDHTDLSRSGAEGEYTQASLHLRHPLGMRFVLGGHLPLGYLETGAAGHWGLSNPMAYGEWMWRPGPRQAWTLGLQLELPFGDARSGIASEHAMAMPYATHGWRGRRLQTQASLGFAAQLPGAHSHGADAAAAGHGGHAGHEGYVEPPALQAKPHEPYEMLYRVTAALPMRAVGIEPEAFLAGVRVLFAGDGVQRDHVGAGAGLGLRLFRGLQVKPRWEQELTSPRRMDWSLGMDVKYEWASE